MALPPTSTKYRYSGLLTADGSQSGSTPFSKNKKADR
jgi:hypothetical protein